MRASNITVLANAVSVVWGCSNQDKVHTKCMPGRARPTGFSIQTDLQLYIYKYVTHSRADLIIIIECKKKALPPHIYTLNQQNSLIFYWEQKSSGVVDPLLFSVLSMEIGAQFNHIDI
jgi:hypothetical protein